MLQICSTTPIPDFNSLYESALSAITVPPGSISIPILPAIPNPIYVNLNCINMEIVAIIQQFQTSQLLTTFMAFIAPLVKYLGLDLLSILPKIPYTNLTLIDLIALEPTLIYNTLAKLPSSILKLIPGVPVPLYYAFNCPAIQITNAIQGIINGYMNTLIGTVTNLINQVINALDIPDLPGLPTIPTLPSITELQALIIPPGLPIKKITALLEKYSLNALLALAVFPGFPVLPALPIPLILSINIPETNLIIGLGILYASYVTYPMTLIYNYIENTLGEFLSFTFPKICISI